MTLDREKEKWRRKEDEGEVKRRLRWRKKDVVGNMGYDGGKRKCLTPDYLCSQCDSTPRLMLTVIDAKCGATKY